MSRTSASLAMLLVVATLTSAAARAEFPVGLGREALRRIFPDAEARAREWVDETLVDPVKRAAREKLLGEIARGQALFGERDDLWGLPVGAIREDHAEVDELPLRLMDFSDALKADRRTGYDWVFPWFYGVTTRTILDRVRTDDLFEDPALIRAEIAQFYELYAVNANAWLARRSLEPQWRRAARISRFLAARAGGRNDDPEAIMAVAAVSVWAHIVVDLPRSLLTIYRTHPDRPSLAAMRRDFSNTLDVFGPAADELLTEGHVSPELFTEVWTELPRSLKLLLTGYDSPVGMSTYLSGLRELAWLRFELWVRSGIYDRATRATPTAHMLTRLEYGPPAGLRAAEVISNPTGLGGERGVFGF